MSHALQHWMAKCVCVKLQDKDSFHLLICKTGGGPAWTHNSIIAAWSDCSRQLQLHHRNRTDCKIQHTDIQSSDYRPDIYVFNCRTSSMLNWLSRSLFPRDRAALSRKKRGTKTTTRRRSARCIPFVFKRFGGWG